MLDEEKEQIKDLRLHRKVSYRNEPFVDWAVDIDHMTARWPLVYTTERKMLHKRRVRDSTSSTKSLLHEVKKHLVEYYLVNMPLPQVLIERKKSVTIIASFILPNKYCFCQVLYLHKQHTHTHPLSRFCV